MTALTHAASGAGLKPLSPVHPRARREPATGDVLITWIRRTRIGGDSWEQVEVPLAEETEAYAVDILDGASVARTLTVGGPAVRYTAAEQAVDFGAPPATLTIAVQQISASHGRGTPRSETFDV
ncbi:hypothetical protein [Breoghania sp. L-A4]|uniref:hypothetical protein n=1 Tax=Breoghania sp. L-A4 TaxID=2304600 RepID=UPI003204CA66